MHNGSPFSKSASSSLIELMPSFSELDSPYLSGQIGVKKSMSVRMETRRGCLFNCAYCRHRNANCSVYQIGQMERTKKELELFSAAGVKKINVLDPFFNDINNQDMEKAKGLGFLRTCREMNVSSEISLQIRPEMLKKEYLELASDMKNVTFEIGIQSLDPDVYPHIRRGNFRTRNLVLEKPRINKNMLNFMVSSYLVLNLIDSFQSTCACIPGLVSNLMVASVCFSALRL